MHLRTVAASDLAQVWPRVQPWIAEACRRGTGDQSPADLLLLCHKGEAALILICQPNGEPVAAGVAQVRDHADGKRSCWILAVGGSEARAWRDTLAVIEANAARIGCHTVEFVGRAGWAALLPEYECRVSYVRRLDPSAVRHIGREHDAAA